jgi:hypothetical protein
MLAAETKEQKAVRFLSELKQSTESEALLMAKVLTHAAVFTQSHVAKFMFREKPEKLRDLLAKIQPHAGLTIEQTVGIAFGKIACWNESFYSLPDFLFKLDNNTRNQVLDTLNVVLHLIIKDKEIVRWITENWWYITRKQVRLIAWFNLEPRKDCYLKLQASRIYDYKVEIENLNIICDLLAKTEIKGIINEYLENYPNSPVLPEDKFGKVLLMMMYTENIRTVLKNFDLICRT